jgi:hypothetical protein
MVPSPNCNQRQEEEEEEEEEHEGIIDKNTKVLSTTTFTIVTEIQQS